MTIRVYADTDENPPPGREWLARIERGTTATVVFGATKAEVRAKAEAAVVRERELQERLRAAAANAARALRAAIADPTMMGERSVMFLDFSTPGGRRRGECRETWAGLPGFLRVDGRYRHDLLPGWEYARAEIKAEMIPDLEALAERGVRPTEATSAGVSR